MGQVRLGELKCEEDTGTDGNDGDHRCGGIQQNGVHVRGEADREAMKTGDDAAMAR